MVVDGVVVQPEEYVLVVQVGENDERLQAARVGSGRWLVASRGSKTAGNADLCDNTDAHDLIAHAIYCSHDVTSLYLLAYHAMCCTHNTTPLYLLAYQFATSSSTNAW